MDLHVAIVTTPTLITSELLVSIVLVPQSITTDLTDFRNPTSLVRHKTFAIQSPPIPSLIVLYCKMKFLHTVG